MTLPEPSVPTVTTTPVGAEETIRATPCAFCGQRLRISFFVEVWSGSFVYASGGHVCPNAPVQPLPGDEEAAA